MNSCKSCGVGPRSCAGPVGGCGDGKKLSELRHPLCLAPRRKHVVGQMEFIVLLPAVRSKEGLNVTPRALDSICVIPGVRINERDRMIHGAVRVTVGPDILIRSPAIADERGAGFDPSTNNARQCVGQNAWFQLPSYDIATWSHLV